MISITKETDIKGGNIMWTRKELKEKSKIRFRANYWKSVLVALVIVFITAGSGFSAFGESESDESAEYQYFISEEEADKGESVEGIIGKSISESSLQKVKGDASAAVMISVAVIVIVVAVIFICIILIPLQIFVFNPLEIGGCRFFIKNLKEDAQAKEMCYAFDKGYKNNVKTLFFRDLYTILWTFLFIIPGIVKAYEYQMIPYILAENPGMDTKEAFALSKKMMHGNKWKAFLLDCSFFGWILLDVLTLGILGVFYVNPYMLQTQAALYEKIKNQ